MRSKNRSCANITVKRAKFANKAARKSDGMTAAATINRHCDRSTFAQCLNHPRGIRRSHQRHIGERNEPAIGVSTAADAKGQTGAHSPVCIGDWAYLGIERFKTRLKIARPATDDDYQTIYHGPERSTSCFGNPTPIRQHGKQFVAAKP
jgi:hypothetical protein